VASLLFETCIKDALLISNQGIFCFVSVISLPGAPIDRLISDLVVEN
jgi:hypothetical protein